MVESVFSSFTAVLSLHIIIFILIGLSIGIILGAIPGLGAVLGMAIVLPLTIPLSGLEANILLVAIYSGALYGASISAILLNVPGTAAAAATTFDGYALTKQGKAKTALAISAVASAIGGGLTILMLLLLVPYLSRIVLAFGAPEIFLLSIFGILMIGLIASKQSLVKGILSGALGILVMTIGIAPQTADVRFNLGSLLLYDGVNFVALAIGMFALGEMLRIAVIQGELVEDVELSGTVFTGVREVISRPFLTVKSGMIGMLVGAVPGIGGATANFFSYTEALRSAKESSNFGNGDPAGVIASEASNNGTVAGSLIPLLSFGIPGSAATAILLGGFIMHGINPGPEMFGTNIEFTYSLIFSLIIGNVFILIIGLVVIANYGPLINKLDTDLIIPVVIVLSIAGAYVLRTNWADLLTVLIFGILAYYMNRYGYSVIALVIGAVLSRIIETNLSRSLTLSEGSPLIFVGSPLSISLVLAIVVFTFGPYLYPRIRNQLP